MMGERDWPRMAAGFLAWVTWVDLHFLKYMPCNTGREKVLCQEWLYPQINLRNVGLNKSKPDLFTIGLLRALNMLVLLQIIVAIIIKHLHEFHLLCL